MKMSNLVRVVVSFAMMGIAAVLLLEAPSELAAALEIGRGLPYVLALVSAICICALVPTVLLKPIVDGWRKRNGK